VFGNKRRQEDLEVAAKAAEQLLKSVDVVEMKLAASALRATWLDAGHPDGDGFQALSALEGRIDSLQRRRIAGSLRSCAHCTGRRFRISDERHPESLGKIRLVVCESCGAMTMFWADLERLTASGFGEAIVVAEAVGPFR